MSSAFAQPGQDIRKFLEENKEKLGLSETDLIEFHVTDHYTSQRSGITHLYVQQQLSGLLVYNGILNLNIRYDDVLSFGNRWIPGLAGIVRSPIPDKTAEAALQRALQELNSSAPSPVKVDQTLNEAGQVVKVVFDKGSYSRENIPVDLLWLPVKAKEVKLVWMAEIQEVNAENVWRIFIDAHTGEFVKKDNQVMHCVFDQDQCISGDHERYSGDRSITPKAPMLTDSSYRVFARPVESPNHGDRSLAVRPWLDAGTGNDAVTLGWHYNGTTHYSITRGNNVYAYEDIDHNDLPGFSPASTVLSFDFAFDPHLPPSGNQSAALTNLFYWNNIMHDVTYQYGFDEVSGNFQTNNLSRGGVGNDHVLAEGLDGGGTNNANFYTPVDGGNGRMQMYLWAQVPEGSPLTINSPPSVAGDMWAIESNFSTANKLANVGHKQGNLLFVNDASGMTHEACGTMSNADSLAGRIALLDRGNCDFVTKVKNVQNHGAIAAIVVNNVPGDPIVMGGSDNTIVIPAVMVSQAHGQELKNALLTHTVNASLDPVVNITPDGDYDSGIICHEYGHGVSMRLTGGPSVVSCLNNEEQMGEGWSDFFGLMLTTDWTTAQPTDPRGIGTYVLGDPPDGTGIRTYPYTTDMDVNPFTYADIADAPLINGQVSPHFIGSVWCTMLWDMVWNIIAMEGVDPDVYSGAGGNNIAMQLVMDGLKLQACNPGFVDGRNAILLADELDYGGIHKCAIWHAFAGRGLGLNASQGNPDNNQDGTESYAIPDGINIINTTSTSTSLEGQEVSVSLRAVCECEGKGNITFKDELDNNLLYVPGYGGALNGQIVSFPLDTLAPLDTADFVYHAVVKPCSAVNSTIISLENVESTALYHNVKLAGSGNKTWLTSTAQAASPTHSWYAQDYPTLADIALTLNNALVVNRLVQITFKHKYQTEPEYDGGVVEYSLNGGTTWLDAGPYFTQNGYPSAITTIDTDSPLIGRPAFTGNSSIQFNDAGFIQSTILLALPQNQSLLLRFRFASDGGVPGAGLNGWYIDDITIRQLSGVVSKAKITSGNVVLDSLYHGWESTIFGAGKIYVDATAGGGLNGTSWANAMHQFFIAGDLSGCRSIDSILVAEGMYLPSFNEVRTSTFKVGNGAEVYGGFMEGGSPFNLRDPDVYVSNLSGDLGVLADPSDNAYHVFTVDSAQQNILLDGLTLSHGNANGAGNLGKGAALYCLGNLKLRHVTILDQTGTGNGQLILVRNPAARLNLEGCSIHSPADPFTKMEVLNGSRFVVRGTNSFLSD